MRVTEDVTRSVLLALLPESPSFDGSLINFPAMDITSRLSNHFQSRSPSVAFLYAAILAVLIGVIDYLTGYEVTFFPFYSFPILLLVWRGETRRAIGIAVLSAFVWWAADTASGHVYSQEWLRIWDSVVRLMFFCLVVVSGTMLKSRGDASRKQIELLERSNRLEEQIIEISEREQQRLGHDLHDGLCQYLASLVFVSDSLKENLRANAPQFADSAGELSRLLRQGVLRARDIARGLSPVDRDEGGLESALSDLASSTARLVGIYCSFVAEGHVDSLSDQEAVDVFRIAQEALANAVKHGLAKKRDHCPGREPGGFRFTHQRRWRGIRSRTLGARRHGLEHHAISRAAARWRPRDLQQPSNRNGDQLHGPARWRKRITHPWKHFMKTKKIRVIIVEDHPMFRERLAQLINAEKDLELAGEADSFDDAIRLVRDSQPDLALVDVTLKGGSGLVLINALRGSGFSAPILVLSMHEESLYAERAIRAGANGYITKHRASSDVLLAIRRVLSGEMYLSEKMTSDLARTLSRSGKWGPSRSLGRLTDRETEVLRLIGQGQTTREIADALGIGIASVDTYRARIKEKMNLRNGTELQHFAIRCVAGAD